MPIYQSYLIKCKDYTKLQHNICVSKCNDLSLEEYCFISHIYCICHHDQQKCTKCHMMIETGKLVLDHGLISLSEVFRYCFPNSTYTSAKAKRRLLQLSLAGITLNSCSNGKAEVYLLEAL